MLYNLKIQLNLLFYSYTSPDATFLLLFEVIMLKTLSIMLLSSAPKLNHLRICFWKNSHYSQNDATNFGQYCYVSALIGLNSYHYAWNYASIITACLSMLAMELLELWSKGELIIYNVPSPRPCLLIFLLNYVTETKLTLVSAGCL